MDWLTVRKFAHLKFFTWSPIVLIGVPLFAEIWHHVTISSLPLALRIGFAASVCYVLGFGIFQFFCPEPVKKFATDFEYVTALLPAHLNMLPSQKLNVVLAWSDAGTQNQVESLLKSKDPADLTALEALIKRYFSSCVQRYLLNRFQYYTREKRLWSVVSLLFYLAGTVLALILILLRWRYVFDVFK